MQNRQKCWQNIVKCRSEQIQIMHTASPLSSQFKIFLLFTNASVDFPSWLFPKREVMYSFNKSTETKWTLLLDFDGAGEVLTNLSCSPWYHCLQSQLEVSRKCTESKPVLESWVGLLWWITGFRLSKVTMSNKLPQLHFSIPFPGGIIIWFGNKLSSLFILLFFSLSSLDGGYSNVCLKTFASAPSKFRGFSLFSVLFFFYAGISSKFASLSIKSVLQLVFLATKFSFSPSRALS